MKPNRISLLANGLTTPLSAFLGAHVVSSVGNSFAAVALPWFVLQTTGSVVQTGIAAAAAGFVAAARTLPYLLLSLPAGALVDRWDRKATMAVCSAGGAVALA